MRREQILQSLQEHGECTVESLAHQFGVSDMTIRRDLQALADAGKVLRTHGGAAPTAKISFEFQFLNRSRSNLAAKQAIALLAAEQVDDGQSIMLDSGTTTLALAHELRRKADLTVITTSLPIASELQFSSSIEIVLLGGILRSDAPDLVGALTEANLETLHADIAFVGADGIDAQGNAYNDSIAVGRMLSKMIASATRVFVVADGSKIGRHSLMRFGNIAQFEALITDGAADEQVIETLQSQGVRVLRAPLPSSSKSSLRRKEAS